MKYKEELGLFISMLIISMMIFIGCKGIERFGMKISKKGNYYGSK